MRRTLLHYSLYYCGLELNQQYFQGMPVPWDIILLLKVVLMKWGNAHGTMLGKNKDIKLLINLILIL